MTVCLVLILAINFLGARAYGETEFWFSTMKVLAIVGLIILGVVLMCGGGPNHDPIGFRYWVSPGTSPQARCRLSAVDRDILCRQSPP